MGSEPKDLFIKGYYNTTDKNKTLIMLYVSEINNYKKRIDFNKDLNLTRWDIFHNSIWKVILSPVLLALSYLISLVVFHCLPF